MCAWVSEQTDITEPLGRPIPIFLKNYHTDYHNDCTNLDSYLKALFPWYDSFIMIDFHKLIDSGTIRFGFAGEGMAL